MGFIYGTPNLLNQLGTLTTLSSVYMDYANWYINFSDSDIDLSGMTGLKTITMKNFNFKSLKLPSGINSITMVDCGCFPNLSNLNSLTYLKFEKGGQLDNVTTSNVLTSLSSKVWNEDERITVSLSNLNELSDLSNILPKFNATSLTIDSLKNIYNVNGINNMKNLTSLTLKNNPSLINLTGLSSLTGLTTLYMNNCGVSDLSDLASMSSLNYIDLQNSVFAGSNNLNILVNLIKANPKLKLYLKRVHKYFRLV